MQNSIIDIGNRHEEISSIRKDDKRFISKDFFEFAKQNKNKYSIVENGINLLVSTWYSNDLINDYIKTL